MSKILLALLAFSHSLIFGTGLSLPCGGNFNGKQGVIKTPGYPQTYKDNLECIWKITTPKDHTVKLSFLHFALEKSVHCTNDFVKVYDGGSTSKTMIGKYCGGMRPFAVLASTNKMTVQFKSDYTLGFPGLKAKFVAVPKNGPVIPKTTQQPSQKAVVTSLPTTTRTTSTAASTTTATTTTQITTIATTSTTKQVTTPAVSISFAKPLPNVTVCISGSTCKLICEVRGSKGKFVTIKWSKDDNPINGGTPRVKIKRKYRKSKRSVLVLKNVSKDDNGVYGCHVTDPYSKQFINIFGKLQVEERKIEPEPPFIFSANLNATVDINDEVVLSCMVNGSQPITIRWIENDGKSVLDKDPKRYTNYYESFHTIHVQEPISFEVRCVAENQYGRDVKTGFIRVNKRPPDAKEKPVIINMAALNLTAKTGEKVVLRCGANGAPPVSMRWLIDNRYYKGKQSRYKDSYTSHFTLVVKKRTKVRCEAQNPYGIDAKTGVITVQSDIVARKSGPWDTFKPGKKMFYIVIAGGIAFLILVVITIACFRKKAANTKYKVPEPIHLEQLTRNPIFERTNNTYVNPKIEKWNIHRNNIEFIKDIENGVFSRLFLGRMTHTSRGEQDALVQVKVLKESSPTDSNKETFEEEAIELTSYDHPNVQSLVGVCVTGRPLCLVFECSDRGDLNQFLRDSGCSHYIIRERPNSSLDPDTKLSKLDQLCIAKQIAAGMQYLSDRRYSHRELCTKNCMINKNMTVKVANIGLHDAKPNTSYGCLGPIEKSSYPVRWLPFESVTSGIFTDTTDVWSFGIVLWEIYSYGITPYYGMNNDEVIALVREGDILPLPKECPREMYDVMQDCWSLVPHERPSFRFLYEKISALVTGVAV